MARIKTWLTSIILLAATCGMAQDNKFEAGDFGIRYGVMFNGSAVQGLTFSGMVTNNIEVGGSINVQYSKSSGTTNGSTTVETDSSGSYGTSPAQSTIKTRSSTLNTSFNPFVFYHIKIKNNLDVYAGPNILVGTVSHTLNSTNDNVIQATNYYYESYSHNVYPIGYQVGGGINVGGQYFFYKRLALGVQAGLGVAYSCIDGDAKSINHITNTGTYNPNASENTNSAVFAPYVSKGLSLTTASSIGVNLTFYLARKAKASKKAEGM